MATSVQYRQQEGSLGRGGMMVMEKDDDLSLFLDMRDSNMEKNNPSLVHSSQDFDDLLELKLESSLISEITPMINGSEPHADDLLSIENNKNDYEWLLAPPENPEIPSVEKKAEEIVTSQTVNTNVRASSQQPRLANPAAKPTSATNKPSTRSATSNAGIRRPSPSKGPTPTTSRSTTPVGRTTLASTTKSSRPSTPTSRATLTSSTKPTAPPRRSSTPTTSSARSSTPTARPPALTISKSTSRSSTPTSRPSAPSTSGPTTSRSSSVTKSRSTVSKTSVPSRGNSPAVKSRPSLPEKPALESRGRPSLPIVKVSSTENNRLRRNSCSPSRGKLSNGIASNNIRSSIGKARGYSDINDDVNPVLMGTKMVERVVNMRKLAPPKQDDHHSNSGSGKSSSSQENSGFGRSLSKKSFDMALRHMDIRRSMPGNLRAMITKVPASSMYSVRSDSAKSSSASSELSLSNNSHGSEAGDTSLDG